MTQPPNTEVRAYHSFTKVLYAITPKKKKKNDQKSPKLEKEIKNQNFKIFVNFEVLNFNLTNIVVQRIIEITFLKNLV